MGCFVEFESEPMGFFTTYWVPEAEMTPIFLGMAEVMHDAKPIVGKGMEIEEDGKP
jgi:hypothetical protein